MTTPLRTAAASTPLRRLLLNRFTVIAFVAGASVALGATALARNEGMGGWHHGMLMNGNQSPAEVQAHIDHFLKHFYVEIDATDAQQAQIGPLVKQAVSDLMPLRSQLHSAHTQVMQALTQTTVDRAALEAARTSHLQLADQASKRITQLLGDVGDVLTPTQRKALADHLQRLHGVPNS